MFFIGMRMVGSHLRQLAGSNLRSLLAHTFKRPGIAQLAGFVSGALTQSTSAVTFIVTGLVSAGTLPLAVALVMLAWANVGTSVLVLAAAFDAHVLILYLMGMLGVAFFSGLDQSERFRHAVFALLGIGLLLLGIAMLKDSVTAMNGNPWVVEFMQFAGSGAAVAFLAGMILAIGVQSSSIVTILALPLVQHGLLSMEQTAIMIYGANTGSGIAVLLLASGLEGTSKQVALCQGILRGLAATVLVVLYLVETSTGVPLLLSGIRWLAAMPGTQAGLIHLAFQLVIVVIAAVAGKLTLRLAVGLAPPSQAESVMKPAYLFPEAVQDPATALSLVRLEYLGLVRVLPDYLEDLRPPEERAAGALPLQIRHAASSGIASAIENFLGALMRANHDLDAEKVFEDRSRLQELELLQLALSQFAQDVASLPDTERPPFAGQMVEGLHALLTVVVEAIEDDSSDAREMVQLLTEERGALIERVRSELLSGAASLAGREALLSAIMRFERIVWMLRRLAPVAGSDAMSLAA